MAGLEAPSPAANRRVFEEEAAVGLSVKDVVIFKRWSRRDEPCHRPVQDSGGPQPLCYCCPCDAKPRILGGHSGILVGVQQRSGDTLCSSVYHVALIHMTLPLLTRCPRC
ncbi:hypothetical protein E2C01_031696 [Portunus trituberculatus]|uniref:Uncharacterized protein n=1 Tax=Portunus trituberculatus TaxID=210409 RepID=A0A5B7EVE4_PORTR|nr:hypothetical protein [Portunus trituberculatus]